MSRSGSLGGSERRVRFVLRGNLVDVSDQRRILISVLLPFCASVTPEIRHEVVLRKRRALDFPAGRCMRVYALQVIDNLCVTRQLDHIDCMLDKVLP